MVDYTTTPTYAFKMPTDHVNTNTWGGYNNGNWSSADGLIGSIRAQLNANFLSLTKTNSVEADVIYNGVVGASKMRWAAGIDAGIESGSNANSNYHLNRYDDNGAIIDTAFSIIRSSGNASFSQSLGVNGGLNVNGASSFGAGLGVTGSFNVNGGVGVTGSATITGSLTVASISVSGNVSAASANFGTLSTTGAAAFSSTLTVGSTLTYNAMTGGNATMTGLTVNGNLIVSGTGYYGGVLQCAGNLVQVIQTSGDFGYDVYAGGPTWRGKFGCRGGSDSSVGLFTNYSSGNIYIDGGGNFVFQNGTGTALKNGGGSWTAISDARIKTVTGDYAEGLSAILQLRPVTYVFKGNDTPSADVNAVGGDPEAAKTTATSAPYPASSHFNPARSGKQFVGFVAQELETIFPSMVIQSPGFIDGQAVADLRAVDTSELIYALVNAVKELKSEIEALKAAKP